MRVFSKIFVFCLFFVAGIQAQEAIKFQILMDSSGAPLPMVLPPKPDTVQKLGVASNRPLNLAELSVKDTAGFETYSRRYAIVQDSISALNKSIESVKKNTVSFMPKLEPKGEFEKQAEYEIRRAKWDKELYERTERDTKPLAERLAEFQKAKKKIQDNQASLYGSADIKSNPGEVSITINKELAGQTPMEYKTLIPGTVKIELQKEGYHSWDTTFNATPGMKLKINAALEEKSIFSQENEIVFSKLLSKNTNVKGYFERIETVKARKIQVDEEIKLILADFSDNYPVLEPQKPDETPEQFVSRRTVWTNNGMEQVAALQQKHEIYVGKLERSVHVLNDYIAATQSAVINEAAPNAKIELGAYDSERETFEVTVIDTSSKNTPFYFAGNVGVPLDTAKIMNRSTSGFLATVHYLNYPFVSNGSSLNLAIKDLSLSRKTVPLKVTGEFKQSAQIKSMDGYDAWRFRADSLLQGTLKPQNLDYAYAMGKGAAKEAATVAKSEKSSGEGLGWRGWTRIAAFSAAGIFGIAAISKNSDVKDREKKYNELVKSHPDVNTPEYDVWFGTNRNEINRRGKNIKDAESARNTFGAIAGILGVAGAVTFFF